MGNKFWKWKNLQVKNESGNVVNERTLILDGEIASESWFGDEVTPEEFKSELLSGSGPIKIWINSPGGDCIAAAQIYNMLNDYKVRGDVTVFIDGIAASAASVIAMAGTKVVMSPVGMMMIHNPLTLAWGNKSDFDKAIQMLDEVKESIINAYEIKTGLSREEISNLMDNETWMNAVYAHELGFCDEIQKVNGTNDETEPKSYAKLKAETNLKNKLEEKYLIKKQEPKGLSLNEINNRLNLIQKYI